MFPPPRRVLPIGVALLSAIGFLAPGWTVSPDEAHFAQLRHQMVARQLRARDITDPRVLAAMEKVPRHRFVDPGQVGAAYQDRPLPIGEGQTISQPYIVALMTQLLQLKGSERVLEVGTGSGYQAAILGELASRVYTVEIFPSLEQRAAERLRRLGYANVQVRLGDGYYGWPEHAPFNAIMVTAAANHVPPPLLDQLGEGGRLVIPVGPPFYTQTLVLAEKRGGRIATTSVAEVLFVPLLGGPGR